MATLASSSVRRWLQVLLVVLGFNVGNIILSVALYPSFLVQSQSWQYLAEPLVLLATYTAIILGSVWHLTAARSQAIRFGAAFGIATGGLWIINLSLETFMENIDFAISAVFLLGGFGLWGIAGLVSGIRTRSFPLGVFAAIWSGMICVVITITYGLLLPYVALARLKFLIHADPDYVRSGWTDLHAFVLANQFDSAFSHLLGALVIGTVVGAFGSGIALLVRGLKKSDA